MKFKYQAKTKEGETQVGFVEAANRDSAIKILGTHQLFILKIDSAEEKHWYDRVAGRFSGVRRGDMVVFTRQLATLLEARLSLDKALTTLHDQTANSALREAINQISEDIDSGLAFSQALEKQSNIFSTFFVSMVRSAEVTGNLDQVATFLADFTEKEAALIAKARSAMIYPAIILSLFVVVAIVMITMVFPQIKPIFEQSGIELPFLTSVLMNSGSFLTKWWILITAALLVVIYMVFDYTGTEEGKALMDEVKLKTPIVRKVYLPITVTRFANAAGMLAKGGVPIAQVMEIVGETIDNILYRDILHEVSQDVRSGVSLSEALSKHPKYFPTLVPQMVAVGEATGRLDEMFLRVGNFYNRQSDSIISTLVDLIQPIMMVVMAVLVGLLFSSILMPLYTLTSGFQ